MTRAFHEDELRALIEAIGPLDEAAIDAARAHQDRLTKPAGSLGRLEDLAVRLAGITGQVAPPVEPRAIVVAAADHGVTARGVSAYPSDVTRQMVANFAAGGAAINVLARAVGASVVVLDVGVAGGQDGAPGEDGAAEGTSPAAGRARIVYDRVRDGTADMSAGPAMTRDDALAAIGAGVRVVDALRATGLAMVGTGEMGIGNTTAASALVAALTGEPAAVVTGPGTGLDAEARERKAAIIEQAIAVNAPDAADPLGVLAAVGGLEIAALVGVILAAAAARIPVVLDGFITGAAALVACALAPATAPRLVAGHRSPEPGHAIVLNRLGLSPLLDLGMRLGEGSGAAVAMGVIAAAAATRDGMATFESAGVSGPA